MGRKLVFRTPPGGCNVSLLVLVKFFLSYLGRLPQLGSDRTHFPSVFIEMLISSLTGRQGKKKTSCTRSAPIPGNNLFLFLNWKNMFLFLFFVFVCFCFSVEGIQ